MRRNRLKIAFVALLFIGALASARADKIDDYVKEQMATRHIPGIAIGVVQDGKLTLARGYGMANVEQNVPVTENTVFEIGSMTKQFTATAVMMLVEEGKIGLDEKITKYLPELPEAWKEITVRHLLTHTSGIKNYTGVGNVLALERNPHTQQEILKLVADRPLNFLPGEKWVYCNTGYFLLGMIIEKVSDKPYTEFLSERIFKPLGMDVTRDCDPAAVIPNRAFGYIWAGKMQKMPLLQPSSAFSAGFLVSTVGDMAKWDAALYSDKLLKTSSLKEMWTPAKLKNGAATGYGFGWFLGSEGGHKVIQHGGRTAGFSTMIFRYPDDKLTILVLINLKSGDPGSIARGIAATYLTPQAEPVKTPIPIPQAEPVRTPIEDKDPALTKKLQAVVVSIAEGKLDPDLFTPEAKAALFPERANQAAEVLKQLGALKSFMLVEQKKLVGLRKYTYKAEYEKAVRFISFALTEEGKIARMNIARN